MAKYSKKAGDKVGRAMHEEKRGQLKSGRSGRKVTSRKQAIAIGLSEARSEGAKVPDNPNEKRSASKKGGRTASKKTGRKTAAKKTGRKTASKKGGRTASKKTGRKTAAKKTASKKTGRKTASKKTASKKTGRKTASKKSSRQTAS